MAYWLLSKVIWGYAALPFHILDHMMVTYLSRSARDCSCTKPRACINSWTVTPDPVHSGVCREMVCLPPRAPRYDQHLRYRSSKMMRITQNNHAVPQEINMMLYPVLGWMSRKSLWWVLGTKRTHVSCSMSSMPFLMFFTSSSPVQRNNRNQLTRFTYLVTTVALYMKMKKPAYCTHERVSMQCTHFHSQIWSTGSSWQNSSSDSYRIRLYLLL